MATRINTKFVITLVSVIVLMVLGLVFAFMFLKKSAADHINLAEAAMVRADAAMQADDIEEYNSELQRAAKHFGSAKAKDAGNTESLYGYIDANQKIICDNLTNAGNTLDAIIAGAANLHDTPGASEEDRKVLYEMLHKHVRMNLVTSGQNPIGTILGFTSKRLDVAPEDPIASKYQALALSYLAQQRTKEAEVLEDIESMKSAAEANPKNPWLQTALARYHQGNARRIYSARGNQFTPEVNASFALSLQYIRSALELAKDSPAEYLETAIVLADARSGDDAITAEITDLQKQVMVTLDAMLSDKAKRDALYTEELSNAILLLRQVRSNTEDETENTFDGMASALRLAEQLPKDRPEDPNAFRALGNLQQRTNRVDEAIKTINAGLAIERLTTADDYIRIHLAELDMKATLADLICTKAFGSAGEERDALLDEATSILDELADIDTLGTEQAKVRDARVNLLRGRIALAQNRPALAVSLLDQANQTYGNRNPMTLRLLAQAHTRLNNDSMVLRYYEMLATSGRTTIEDLLNLINLYMNPGENQQLEKAEAQLDWFQKQAPDDIRGIRLRARLLQTKGQVDDAIAMLKENIEKHPTLVEQIAALQAAKGDTSGVLKILRERLAETPEGEKMNMQLVSQLLNLLPDPEQKKAEIKQLATQGLDPEFAAILERVLVSGKTNLDDDLTMVDLLRDDPAEVALQKYLTYRRWNEEEKGRPYLDKAIELAPKNPTVIEWRFKIALDEEKWDQAQKALRDMLALPTAERSPIAIADGRFMRAQILAAQAGKMEAGEARNKRVREAIVAYNNALDQYNHYVEGWLQLSRLYLAEENYFAAQDSIQEALNRQSQNVTALELLALSQAATGDQINALENYQQVLRIQPNNANALNRFTALAQSMGLSNRAIQQREQIRTRVPSNYDNRRALALLYNSTNARVQAKKAIQDVVEEQGKTLQNIAVLSEILIASNETDLAIQSVNDYLATQGEQATWRDYLLKAQVLEQAKQSAQADLTYAKAIELEKAEGTLVAAGAYGTAKIARGQAQEVAKMYEAMIEANPDNEPLKLRTAELYLSLQDFDKAEAIASRMTASAQRERFLVRSASVQQGKLGIAIERARTAVKTYPSDFGLNLIYIELLRLKEDQLPADNRDYSKVLGQAKALTKDHPDQVDAMVALADVLLKMSNIEKASAELEKALAFAPNHFGANERIARVRLAQAAQLAVTDRDASQERAREALAILSTLLESQPNNANLLQTAGSAAEVSGFRAQAIEYYRQAFEQSKSGENLAIYVNALLSANQGANARAVLDNPENATLVSNSLFLRALRGRALAAAGQPDLAARLFGNLLKENKEPVAQMRVAQQAATAFAAEPSRAIDLFEASLGETLPVQIDALLADLLLARKDYVTANKRLIKYWSKPAQDTRFQITLLTKLALSQQESGQLTQAKATYEKVFAMVKDNAGLATRTQKVQLLNNMAYLLADQLQGYTKEAVDYAKQAVELMTDNDPPMQIALIEDTLGWAYHKAGNNAEAIRVLKGSVARLPLAANQLHLGQVYLAEGDKDSALPVLQKAMDLARSQNDEKMFAEAQKYYREAL
ncbi:MAG: tetratricopeptide repeat protein [Phycisphaeraceae bacterium]